MIYIAAMFSYIIYIWSTIKGLSQLIDTEDFLKNLQISYNSVIEIRGSIPKIVGNYFIHNLIEIFLERHI